MGDEHPAYAPDGARPGLPFTPILDKRYAAADKALHNAAQHTNGFNSKHFKGMEITNK